MAEKIEYTDNLKEGTDKLNESIEQSNTAFTQAQQAQVISEAAKILAESVQEQFNQVVIDGDSSVEAAQARVDSGGTSHPTLKSRLDNFEVSATQQMAQSIDVFMAPYRNIGTVTPRIELPFDLKITKGVGNRFTYHFEEDDFIPFTPSITLWISPEGNDSTGDGTEQNPYKTVSKCISLGDNILINAKSGMYNRVAATVLAGGKNLKIIGENETYFLPGDSVEIFTVTPISGYSNVYFINRTKGNGGVFDIKYEDEYGVAQHYVEKTSIEEVENNPGSVSSYTHNSVNGIIVNCFDGRKPDKYIVVDFGYSCFNIQENKNTILKNIKCVGGMGIAIKGGNLLLENFSVENTWTQNGCGFQSVNVVAINSEANGNKLDGFNYHNTADPTNEYFAVEINCKSIHNGWGTPNLIGQNQGSTVHENYEVLRLNGVYQDNAGSNIADVNNHKTHLINCIVERPDDYLKRGISLTNIAHIDSCVIHGEPAFYLNESTVYLRNNVILGEIVGGTIINY